MTNTEIASATEIRREWLLELSDLALRGFLDDQDWFDIIQRMLLEGPELGRSDFREWQRRFINIKNQYLYAPITREVIVVRQLLELMRINESGRN